MTDAAVSENPILGNTDSTGEPAPLAAHAPVKPESPLFADFPIRPEIVEALKSVGIERTFAIQELTLPIALAGSDLIGQARTGTGKTLGFGVPLLNRLQLPSERGASPQALVIAPTRELAVQVAGDLATAGKRLGAKVVTIYGGRAYEPQVTALKAGCDVVVGTPGRLLDLTQQGHLRLGYVRCLVLDEADEMLDLGFLPDIEKLLAQLPAGRQNMLFSATMPGPIVSLARQFLTQPVQIRAESDADVPATEHVDQFAYRAHSLDKGELLAKVLQANGRGLTMIFTRTKRTAQKVADDLTERGFAVAAVHGDLGQGAREQALRAFRSGKVDVLVATDVAARGLDVDDVTHVINYQCPEDAMTYVHRIGRTARAGKSGTSVTLIDWDELPKWKLICDNLNLPFHEPAETYSTSPHLFLELDIPAETKSVLPRAARTRAGLAAEQIEDLGGPDAKRSRPRSRRSGRDRSDGGAATETKPGNEAPKRSRQRRRTRAGMQLPADSGEQAGPGSAAAGTPGSASAGASGSADASGPAGSTGSAGGKAAGSSRSRRRSRGPVAERSADAEHAEG
ncbi:MAG TPA: DEAD/DEAH box helicase [Jatrophihabitans sp.]|nr:DEAD/DEAH box helicase [Jatrophihabitans sp.]